MLFDQCFTFFSNLLFLLQYIQQFHIFVAFVVCGLNVLCVFLWLCVYVLMFTVQICGLYDKSRSEE
jgi:hypothetical protein